MIETFLKELNSETFIRKTRKGDNEIYIVNANNSPNTINEIGRLREITFRQAGGGTGKSIDLDDYDFGEFCYDQLIVWSPEDNEIVGGYRFICCSKAIDLSNNKIHLSTSHYFHFTENFIKHYLPHTIELGRSWIQPNFQGTTNPRKGLFALDNIWDGLGSLISLNPSIKYFFGKVTMYPTYNEECRDFFTPFYELLLPRQENLMSAQNPLIQEYNKTDLNNRLKGLNYSEGIKVLNSYVREKVSLSPHLLIFT